MHWPQFADIRLLARVSCASWAARAPWRMSWIDKQCENFPCHKCHWLLWLPISDSINLDVTSQTCPHRCRDRSSDLLWRGRMPWPSVIKTPNIPSCYVIAKQTILSLRITIFTESHWHPFTDVSQMWHFVRMVSQNSKWTPMNPRTQGRERMKGLNATIRPVNCWKNRNNPARKLNARDTDWGRYSILTMCFLLGMMTGIR